MRVIRFDNKGWRARFGDGFNEENVSRVVDAFGFIWADAAPNSVVYVGYDTRFEGKTFAELAAGVLSSYGLKAIVSDVACPTPALGWSVAQDEDAVGGIMFTASRASCEFGGITARAANGGPISDEFYEAAEQILSSVPVAERGEFVHADIMTPYLEALRARVDVEAIAAAAPKIVVDSLYGSAQGHMAELLRSMGCDVYEIHGERSTDFGGLHPVPAEPWVDACEQAVCLSKSDMGLVFDSDADRLGVIDENGTFITPHRVVPLLIDHLVVDRGETGRVVDTFSSSAYIRRQAKRLGCPITAVPMGFTRVYREFVEGDVLIGADEYGGISYPSHLCERDGLLSALLMVELVSQRKSSVRQLVNELEEQMGPMYYIRKDIRLDAASIQAFRNILPGLYLGRVCGMEPVEIGHSDGLVLRFADDSWVQLRPSRTEPLVRSCAEAPDPQKAQELVQEACDAALRSLPHTNL